MNDKRDKLAALRGQFGLKTGGEVARERETGTAPPPPVRNRPAPSAHETMRDLAARLKLRSGASWNVEEPEAQSVREPGDFEAEQVLSGELLGAEDSRFLLVRRDFPLEYAQGIMALGEALAASSKQVAFSAADPELQDFNPRTALFMDTETTGLAGGAGTVAFLVGVGYFTGDVFRLDQCFMRDYDDEEAMLSFLDERFRECATVVGYNSKSFDLPLLRTRFIQNRLPFRLEARPHYDLVHAARRFWKRRLSDCSLGNIEREVLGIHRQGDVPGYLIPQLWLDYLHTRDARPLQPVLYHHRMDILSLVSLTAWLSQCLEADCGRGFEHAEDQLSLVRVFFLQKKYAEMIPHARAFLETGDGGPLRRECLDMLGIAHKRHGDFDAMREAFELLLEEFPADVAARLELAKLHEHRTRNLFEAQRLCTEALEHPMDAMAERAIRHRLQRIEKKLGKGGVDLSD